MTAKAMRAKVPDPAQELQLTPRLTVFLAVSTGLSVANLYYVQPLLHAIGQSFHVSQAAAGEFATVMQVG